MNAVVLKIDEKNDIPSEFEGQYNLKQKKLIPNYIPF